MKRLFIGLVSLIMLIAVGSLGIDQFVRWSTSSLMYSRVVDVPSRPAALVLGTSKYVGKRLNQFYIQRILKTVELYRKGKVKQIIVSGDRASRYYDEPKTMRRDLIKRGVPKDAIVMDATGYRTLDSIEHVQQRFGYSKFIIVSQKFHLARALFIAKAFDLDCVGIIAADAPLTYYWMTRLREIPARVWAVFELYILRPIHSI